MKTKKLTKKQLNILQGVNDSLETSRIVLKKYKDEDNFELTSHMQDSIKEKISGIVTFLIYYDLKTINKENVMAFVDSIFTPKEKKRIIVLSKWARDLKKDPSMYTFDDCERWIEIWKAHLKSNMINQKTYDLNIKDIESVRPKTAQAEIDRMFFI